MSTKLDSRKLRLGAFLAVMGPGIIAGLSDDDPAGITTYSQLGAQFGYQLLWTLGISTIALILFATRSSGVIPLLIRNVIYYTPNYYIKFGWGAQATTPAPTHLFARVTHALVCSFKHLL